MRLKKIELILSPSSVYFGILRICFPCFLGIIRPGRIPLFSNVIVFNIVFKFNLGGRC